MDIERRIDCLHGAGESLLIDSDRRKKIIDKTEITNPWFTEANILKSIKSIVDNYLNKETLTNWISKYQITKDSKNNVALVLAGNIPMVGIHDIISVFISGHKSIIKLSEKDNLLIPFFIELMTEYDQDALEYFEIVERLKDYDGVIATGSNNSARYFHRYFKDVASIIRMNRNGIAIVSNKVSNEDLKLLADDVFSYFGLGCRNVSKLYLEAGFEMHRLFESFRKYDDLIHHNKYKNNFDYNNALYLLNSEEYYTNNIIILKPDTNIASRIASVHYEFYNDRSELENELLNKKEMIQCVVSDEKLDGIETVCFGNAQNPLISQYADGVDTLDFLLRL